MGSTYFPFQAFRVNLSLGVCIEPKPMMEQWVSIGGTKRNQWWNNKTEGPSQPACFRGRFVEKEGKLPLIQKRKGIRLVRNPFPLRWSSGPQNSKDLCVVLQLLRHSLRGTYAAGPGGGDAPAGTGSVTGEEYVVGYLEMIIPVLRFVRI